MKNHIVDEELILQQSYEITALKNNGWVYQYAVQEDGGLQLHHYYKEGLGMVATQFKDTLQPCWFYELNDESFRRTV